MDLFPLLSGRNDWNCHTSESEDHEYLDADANTGGMKLVQFKDSMNKIKIMTTIQEVEADMGHNQMGQSRY